MLSDPNQRPAIRVEPGGIGDGVLAEDSVAPRHPSTPQMGGDRLTMDAELSRKLIDGGACLVAVDELDCFVGREPHEPLERHPLQPIRWRTRQI